MRITIDGYDITNMDNWTLGQLQEAWEYWDKRSTGLVSIVFDNAQPFIELGGL